jgi:phospholipase D1/2
MIVDDKRVIVRAPGLSTSQHSYTTQMGSANINDRSQKGNGDSEIALVVEDEDMVDSKMDGTPYQVSRFATTLRRRLYKGLSPLSLLNMPLIEGTEHLGLIPVRAVGNVNDFMRPAPTPNPDEFDTKEDNTVADPLSSELEELWNGVAYRNTQIFRLVLLRTPNEL